MAQLELRWREEQVSNTDLITFLDFAIDGVFLSAIIDRVNLVTVFGGWFESQDWEVRCLRVLALDEAPYLDSGRYEFYVCENCADIGCGSITAAIGATTDLVTWSDFAYEVDWWEKDPSEMINKSGLEHVGPFQFDRDQYREALLAWPLRPRSGEMEEAQDA